MKNKKFISIAKDVINLEIKSLQQLKKKLINHLMMQLFKSQNVSLK